MYMALAGKKYLIDTMASIQTFTMILRDGFMRYVFGHRNFREVPSIELCPSIHTSAYKKSVRTHVSWLALQNFGWVGRSYVQRHSAWTHPRTIDLDTTRDQLLIKQIRTMNKQQMIKK